MRLILALLAVVNSAAQGPEVVRQVLATYARLSKQTAFMFGDPTPKGSATSTIRHATG